MDKMSNGKAFYHPEVFCPTTEAVEELRDALKKKSGGAFDEHVQKAVETEDDFFALCDKVLAVKSSLKYGSSFVVADPLFPTASHRQLVRHLLFATRGLSKGEFFQKNGVHSATLVGAKGIGKSTTLRAFASLCHLICPNVAAVLVSCHMATMRSSLVGTKSLLQVALEQLMKGNYLPQKEVAADAPYHMVLSEMLLDKDLYLLLLVDEFDQLYYVHPSAETGKVCIDTLGQLSFLGDQVYGCYSTFLCGSSGALPLLVAKTAAKEFYRYFPLLNGAPSLNGQKFSSRYIDSLSVDLDTAKEVLGRNVSAKIVRLCAFCVGTTVRALQTAFGTILEGRSLEEISEDPCMQGWKTLDGQDGKFLDAVNRKMYENNKEMIDELFGDGRLDIARICIVDWEKRFRPVSFAEVEAICSELEKVHGVVIRDPIPLLVRLSDRCCVVVTAASLKSVVKVYPFAMIQVAMQERQQEIIDKARRDFSDLLLQYAKSIS